MKQKATILLWVIVLSLSACRAQATPTPAANEIYPELENIPIYPNASTLMEGNPIWGSYQPEGHTIYSYTVQTQKSDKLVKFYEENMPAMGWELLENGVYEVEKRKWESLLYFKADEFVHISFSQWTAASYLVIIDLFNNPNYEQ